MSVENAVQADRIRQYLGHLTLQARSSLLVEIERMQMYDENISGFEIILSELRAEFRKSGQPNNRVGNPSRLFFKPIETLFVDRSPERANAGQISRGSLAPIWEWINHILLPTMAREYCEAIKHAILKDDKDQAKLIVAGFQSKVVKCLEGFLATEQGVANVRDGLGRYTSSRSSLDDLKKTLSVLRLRDAFVLFNDKLPSKINNLEGDSLTTVRKLLDSLAGAHPEAMPFALTMVAKRLETPWQLIRLATKMVRSRNAEEIAATRYAISVAIALDHLDDRRIELKHAVKSNRVQVAKDILTDIYDIEHALRVRIHRIEETDWGRRLAGIMAAVASDLKVEFQTLPGGLHHVLGSHTLHGHHAKHALLPSLIQKGFDLIGLRHR